MPEKTDRLKARTEGSETDNHENSGVGLLIVDMISGFDFEDGSRLFETALPASQCIADLKDRAKQVSIPTIYVNDNYGKWKNDFSSTLEAARSSSKGSHIVSAIPPEADDYHVLKPQRSGFFGTPLNVLLDILNISDLIVTGVTTDICVMFTAHDAYMRGFSVRVPSDCSASVKLADHRYALSVLSRIADADIRQAGDIDLQLKKQQ